MCGAVVKEKLQIEVERCMKIRGISIEIKTSILEIKISFDL